ncbi:MAG: hypothetical protein AAF399_24720 [Bacteroidota bacterium]
MKRFVLVSLATLAILFSSCDQFQLPSPEALPDPAEGEAQVYFLAEFTSELEPDAHTAILISPTEEVRKFVSAENDLEDSWQELAFNPNVGAYYSLEALTVNFNLCETVDETDMDWTTFSTKEELAASAIGGELTSQDCRGPEETLTTLYALVWNERFEYFEAVRLKEDGACTQLNQSNAAKSLIEWMEATAIPLL